MRSRRLCRSLRKRHSIWLLTSTLSLDKLKPSARRCLRSDYRLKRWNLTCTRITVTIPNWARSSINTTTSILRFQCLSSSSTTCTESRSVKLWSSPRRSKKLRTSLKSCSKSQWLASVTMIAAISLTAILNRLAYATKSFKYAVCYTNTNNRLGWT